MACEGGSLIPYLVNIVDRYGEQIEADFHEYYSGLDVVDVLRVDQVEGPTGWRSRRRISLRKFHSLVGQLPQHGRYYAAFADDDEAVAETMAYLDAHPELKRQVEQSKRKKPTMLGQTVEVQKLDHLISVGNLIARLLDQDVSKGKNTRNLPGPVTPETARDRWHRKARERRHNDLVAEVRSAQARWVPPKERVQHNI